MKKLLGIFIGFILMVTLVPMVSAFQKISPCICGLQSGRDQRRENN